VEFATGLACTFRGIVHLAATPSLWGWALAPVVVAAAVLGGAGVLSHGTLYEWVRQWSDEHLGGSAVTGIAFHVLFWVAFGVAMFFVFSFVVRLIAAPFLALLAERTVPTVAGAPAPASPGGPFVRWILRPIGEAIVLLALRLAVTLLALPVLLVPVAGPIIFSIVSMALLGLDLVDIAQSARGIVLGPRMRFAWKNAGACLGLGVGAGLLMLVPCVNVLLLPAAVVAAVLLDSRLAPDFPRVAAA
jgi:CysZ protein